MNTEKLLQEMIAHQQSKLLACGQQIIPNLTADDMLQPNDFIALENHPAFRYEEGHLAGLLAAQMAIRAESFRT